MPKVRTGQIALTENQQSNPSDIAIADTVTDLLLTLTGELNVTAAATLFEDGIMRLLQRIQVTLGGETIKEIGDNGVNGAALKMLFFFNQLQYGVLPQLTQPAVGVGVNAFNVSVRIPFSLPPRLSSALGAGRHISAMQAVDEDLQIVVDWGAVGDVISAGTATLQNVSLEVAAVTDPNLNEIETPMILNEKTQNLQLTTGANTADQVSLNRVGTVPYIMLLGIDAGARNSDVWNRLTYLRNTVERELDLSWDAMQAASKEAAGLQGVTLPVGVNMALFDESEDLSGALPVGDQRETKGWQLQINHDALTAAFRLFHHHYSLERIVAEAPGA